MELSIHVNATWFAEITVVVKLLGARGAVPLESISTMMYILSMFIDSKLRLPFVLSESITLISIFPLMDVGSCQTSRVVWCSTADLRYIGKVISVCGKLKDKIVSGRLFFVGIGMKM